MPGLGSRLKQSREKLGITLEQAGEELNIKSDDLQALEEENFAILPDKQFASTILRLYGEFLKMDPEEIKEEFDKAWAEDGMIKDFIKKTFAPDSSVSHSPSKKKGPVMAVIGLVVLLLFAVGIYSLLQPEQEPEKGGTISQSQTGTSEEEKNSQENKDSSKRDVTAEADSQKAAAEKDVPEEDKNTEGAAPVQSPKIAVEITASRGDCWIEATTDGKRAFYELVRQGAAPLKFTGEKSITVRLGDAGAVDIEYNGKDLGSIGPRGSVIEREFLPQK